MKKFLSTLMLMMAMMVVFVMPVSATTALPGGPSEEYMKEEEPEKGEDLPEDEYMKSPKTSDDSLALYAAAMVAIAATGSVVIARKKEEIE